MAEKNPIKYEGQRHRPFQPGDTLPASTLNLAALLEAGEGIQLVVNPDGTVTIVNTCCE